MNMRATIVTFLSIFSLVGSFGNITAKELSLPDAPLSVANVNVAPLVMLVMGRDHTLYYEAYNDASDLDGDNVLDTQFKPSIYYYGYFDANKCYIYDKTNGKNTFVPTGFTKTRTCKDEGGDGRWSGNFLNYLTTSRIDALRRVLYGGLRKKDDVANPVLVRAYIPQDAHSWGKTWDPQVMASLGIKDISYFADLSADNGYFFANTTLGKSTDNNPPLLRVLTLPKDMTQPVAYKKADYISSVSFAGTPTQWGKIAMPLVSNHLWQAKVSFSGNDQFKFVINYGSGDKWYGYFDNSGILKESGTWSGNGNISTQLTGDKWVVFDDSSYKFQILDAPIEQKLHIWNWVSREKPVAGTIIDDAGGKELIISPTDYNVMVRVCVPNLLETDCKKYNGKYQPIGLLQRYGEGDAPKMKFGLITGSYANNTQGGVLRARIGKMKEEIDSTNGQFKTRNSNSNGPSIIGTLDALKVINFNGSSYDSCGWIDNGPISNGQCQSWGNPIAEMLYESLRYFAGAAKPTDSFHVGYESNPGLVEDSWDDPYTATEKVQGKDVLLNEQCAIPINLIISDVGTSYDSDQIPGTKFPVDKDHPFAGDTITEDISDWTSKVSSAEQISGSFFIGEVLGAGDKGIPSAKTVSNFNNIRGLSPMEPTKEGSYYSAGLAYYGHETDVNKVAGYQKPQTMVVAMASNLPQISIDVAGKKVTLVPFAKTINNGSISDSYYNSGGFQPTNGIVDFYAEKIDPTEGTFRINFEDVEQGADHDMDMIVRYTYRVSGDTVTITVDTEYAASSYVQHAGYVISGTENDGVYLDVRDSDGTQWNKGYTKINPSQADLQYYKDTINDGATVRGPVDCSGDKSSGTCAKLPLTKTRTFKVASSSAGFLPSPLWYAAKWGSFTDGIDPKIGEIGKPDKGEWDSKEAGKPDNYFPVANATNLEGQLNDAFKGASTKSRSATSMSYSSSLLTNDSVSFDSNFEAKYWSGNVLAFPITNGETSKKAIWDANVQLKALGASRRVIVTMDADGSKRSFTEPDSLDGSSNGLSKTQIDSLLSEITETDVTLRLAYLKTLVNYLRGDRTYETKENLVPILQTPFRERNGVLGDIVHSTPVYGVSAGDQQPFLVFGANDGMVHVLNATTGDELFAYIPSTSYKNLYRLSQPTYDSNHRFFVDGTIKVVTVKDGDNNRTIAVGTFGLGAQGAWALDLTTLKGLTASSAADHIMWELTDSDSAKIGYMMNAPAVIPVTSGDVTNWVAIFGNGYNNSEADEHEDSTGEGALLVTDLLTGQIKKVLLTNRGKTNDPTGASRPNGLTEPVAADSDLDGQADALYAGDLFGNVWKSDIKGKAVSSWAFETGTGGGPQPMFTATSRDTPAASQPITVRPSVAYHPNGGLLVMVGTGKYLETTDVSVENQTTQSVYGLWDKPGRTSTILRSKLLEQTIDSELGVDPNKHRETSKNLIEWDKQDGWYLDLFYNNKNSGERLNSKILIRNTVAAFTTLIPSTDPCAGGGTGWYMEIDIYTGSNTNLVEQSALLDGIPSDPVGTITPGPKGDKGVSNVIKLDEDIPPFKSPPKTFKTGAVSWQMLY
jgi:type IV pilus assembly protein PilY1